MILTPDGAVHYLECNPRFFYKINLSMIAGVNFVAHGLPHSAHGTHPMADSDAIKKRSGYGFPRRYCCQCCTAVRRLATGRWRLTCIRTPCPTCSRN